MRPDTSGGQGAAQGAALVKEWAAAAGDAPGSSPLRLCVVEWLLLQDPFAAAPPGRLLPAQRRPGLGVQRLLGTLLTRMAQECDLDALVNRPLYFHNAVMYAASNNTFLNPHMEDCFRCLCRDLCLRMQHPSTAPEAGHPSLQGQRSLKEACHASGAPAAPAEAASKAEASGAGAAPDALREAGGAVACLAQGASAPLGAGAASPQGRHALGIPQPAGAAAGGGGEATGVASMAAVSHAVNCGALRWGRAPQGQPVRWTAQEQIAPISSRAKHFLASPAYQEACVRLSRAQMSEHLATVRALMHPAASPEISPCRAGAAMEGRRGEGVDQLLPSLCTQGMGNFPRKQVCSNSFSREPAFFIDWETELEDVTAIQERLSASCAWYCVL